MSVFLLTFAMVFDILISNNEMDINMDILTVRYEAWFTSRQTSVCLGFGEREYTQHLHNRYHKVFMLFGKKIWTQKVAIEAVPVYAWTQKAASGFTDFRDEFCTKYPRFASKFHERDEHALLTINDIKQQFNKFMKVA